MKKHIVLAALAAASFTAYGQVSEPVSLIKSAESAVRQGRFNDADVLYAQVAAGADSAAIAPALWYLGARAAGQGNRLAAEGFFDRLLRIDPNGSYAARSLTWLGNLRSDDPAAAEALFKQALGKAQAGSTDAQETVRAYALLMRRQGRNAEADTLIETWRGGAPEATVSSKVALPAGVYRVGGGVTAPKLLFKAEPQYTEEARGAKIQGATVLTVDIDPSGEATNIEVLRTLEPGLDSKAIEAVRKWRFAPGAKDGVPVTVRATIEINFRLN